ncbi:mom-4 [Pristionchus pacificus]|nr:mom-4 [Pristionchus pacificus]
MESLSVDVNAPPSAAIVQQREPAASPPPAPRPSTSQEIPQLDYAILKYTPQVLGKGTFGKVIKASYGMHGFVAVKLMDNAGKENSMKREIIRLHTYGSGSEHIVRFYGFTINPKLGYAMEFMDCGSLDDLLNKNKHLQYRIDHVFSWLRQVALGARYMHSVGLMHRDFKPHNLLLRDRYLTIKIGDFGEVGEVKQTMTNCKGSAPWMAPEVFKGKQYTTACDVYSLGIILWQMVTRKQPYPGITAYTILWNTAQGARPLQTDCHPLLWTMIEKMWTMEPAERPSMDHVVEYTNIMMKMFNGYNEPLIDTQPERRGGNVFGANRLSAGGSGGRSSSMATARAHRRGGSYDTALINTEASTSGASSGISTPRAHRPPAKIGQSSSSGATAGGPVGPSTSSASGSGADASLRAVRSRSFAYPQQPPEVSPNRGPHTPAQASIDNGEIDPIDSLERHLKPMEPIWGDAESEEKFNEHSAYAYSLFDTKEKSAELTREKHRLIARLNDAIEVNKLLKRKAFLEKTILDCYTKVENGRPNASSRTPSSPRME